MLRGIKPLFHLMPVHALIQTCSLHVHVMNLPVSFQTGTEDLAEEIPLDVLEVAEGIENVPF
jgi:hypothetical protein